MISRARGAGDIAIFVVQSGSNYCNSVFNCSNNYRSANRARQVVCLGKYLINSLVCKKILEEIVSCRD